MHTELQERCIIVATKPTITYGHGFLDDMETMYGSTVYTGAAGGNTTTTVCTTLTGANDFWNNYYIKYLTGDNAGLKRLISDWVLGTTTLTHAAFPNTCDAGDTFVLSKWEYTSGGATSPDIETQYDDVLKLTATAAGAGNYAFWEQAVSGSLSSTTYTKCLVRWKTSVAAAGIGCVVCVFMTDGTRDYVVGSGAQNFTGVTPEFSTSYDVHAKALTTAKTIQRVEVAAYGTAAATGYVYVEFILLHEGTFTFPNCGHGLSFTPPPRYAVIPIPNRGGDVTQNLGSESAEVTCSCDLDYGCLALVSGNVVDDWKRPQGVADASKTDSVRGQVFYQIAHKSSSEPWQWLDTGTEQFKVTMEDPVFGRGEGHDVLDLVFREYRKSDAVNETYVERFELNL
jgi:hypothetical protein